MKPVKNKHRLPEPLAGEVPGEADSLELLSGLYARVLDSLMGPPGRVLGTVPCLEASVPTWKIWTTSL